MKPIQIIILTSIVFLSINSISAQNYGGYPNQNGYGGQGYGSNRGMGGVNGSMSHGMNTQRPPEVESEKSKKERFDKMMDKFKTELTLDELQMYAISDVMSTSVKKQDAIIKKEEGQDEKIEELKALSETTDRKINEFLNKDQKEKYKKLIDEKKERIEKMKR